MPANNNPSTMSPTELQDYFKVIEARIHQKTITNIYTNAVNACFDACITKPSGRLNGDEKLCVNNCVKRYFDVVSIATLAFGPPHAQI
ncbi:hypothetical protein MXB_2517 [Myxobolus squamalis]|nr:hypothetical protein MXB_2517 [Myxobolus squamalis]